MITRYSHEPEFPSEKHYQRLKEKGFDERKKSEQDIWWWHAYDYGWRRVMLKTREDNSPIDPQHEWFNEDLAAPAEIYYAHKFGRRAPPLSAASWRPQPTQEEIEHAERCTRVIVANIKAYAERTRLAFRPGTKAITPPERLAALGVTATEHKPKWYEDAEALSRGRRELGI